MLSDWKIDSLQSLEISNYSEIELNKDISGYSGISFSAVESEGKLRIQLEDSFSENISIDLLMNRKENEFGVAFSHFSSEPGFSLSSFSFSDISHISFDFTPADNRKLTIKDFQFTGSAGVYGPTVGIDPTFDFYKPHPWNYWAKQVKGQGFTAVDIVIVWKDPGMDDQKLIVDKFHEEGLACRLRLYPTTDGEAYDTHPEWRQKLLNGDSKYDWRTYLCPNDAGFSLFMENKIETICREVPYDAIQLAEPWFEVWGGPGKENPVRGAYACLCDDCRNGFSKLAGIDPMELFREGSPSYFKEPGNRKVYEKWLEFRVKTINDFSIRCYESAQRSNPNIKRIHMYLSDCRVQLDAVREYQAMDLEDIVKRIRPDMLTIEDAWQDWTQPDLSSDFILDYGTAYIERIKQLAPEMRVQSHLDIGSRQNTKRDYSYMRQFSSYTHKAGFDSPSYYEYSIQKF